MKHSRRQPFGAVGAVAAVSLAGRPYLAYGVDAAQGEAPGSGVIGIRGQVAERLVGDTEADVMLSRPQRPGFEVRAGH